MSKGAVALALLLTACGRSDEGGNAVEPRPTPTPSPVPTADLAAGELPAPEFAGAAMAGGHWVYKRVGENPAALFGPSKGKARFTVRCDREAREIVFALSGAMPAKGAAMRIATDSGAARFPAHKADAQVTARSPASFSFLANDLGKSPNRIAIKLGNGKALVMPGDDAVDKVIARCQPSA